MQVGYFLLVFHRNQWRIQDLRTGGGAMSSAEGARIEAPKGLGFEEGVSPLPRKFFDFESENGDF